MSQGALSLPQRVPRAPLQQTGARPQERDRVPNTFPLRTTGPPPQRFMTFLGNILLAFPMPLKHCKTHFSYKFGSGSILSHQRHMLPSSPLACCPPESTQGRRPHHLLQTRSSLSGPGMSCRLLGSSRISVSKPRPLVPTTHFNPQTKVPWNFPHE